MFTRVGGFDSTCPPIVLKVYNSHFQPWHGSLCMDSLDDLVGTNACWVDGRVDIRLMLSGGGGDASESGNAGWRARAKSKFRNATEEQL
eukprot:238026-Amphidinium_carterae.9